MLLLEMYCKAKALWLTRDRGATAAEYALIVAVIVVAIAAVVGLLGGVIGDRFDEACDAVSVGDCAG